MEKLVKTLIEIPLINILSEIFNAEFAQELLISCIVVILNFLILPYLKKGIEKLSLSKEEKEKLKKEVEKISDKITDEIKESEENKK